MPCTASSGMNWFITILLVLPLIYLLANILKTSGRRLPPGPMGIPIIGQSITFQRAMRANRADEWIWERVNKYGPIWKMNIFGKPTVFIHGTEANKFVYTTSGKVLSNKQIESFRKILGKRNLLELSGGDHKRVRESMMTFLRADSLKRCVGKMDEEVRRHIELHWEDHHKVTAMPLIKTLTFNFICTVLFGWLSGDEREYFLKNFQEILEGLWSVPVNLPFTRYNRALRASKRVRQALKHVVHKRKMELEKDPNGHPEDLITCLLRKGEDNNEMSDEEIMDNSIVAMIAGHDTTSVLVMFMIRQLSLHPGIYASVLKEQEEIAKSKTSGEVLTWEDLSKMKYTWRVAMETLRTVPPVYGGFRLALEDIEYGGYIIPKGWQVFWASNMTHMDEKIFKEPSEFDPSRFENQASMPPYSYIPFGGGPRMCPGHELARIETLIVIHYLITRFSWKMCSGDSFCRDPMPVPSEGLVLELAPRK